MSSWSRMKYKTPAPLRSATPDVERGNDFGKICGSLAFRSSCLRSVNTALDDAHPIVKPGIALLVIDRIQVSESSDCMVIDNYKDGLDAVPFKRSPLV